MWQMLAAQALNSAAQAAQGGPSNASSDAQLTPNVGGEFNVNFGDGKIGNSRDNGKGGSGAGSSSMGDLQTPLLLFGVLLIGAVMLKRGKK